MRGIVCLYEYQDDFGFEQIKVVLSDNSTIVLEGDFTMINNGELIEFDNPKASGLVDGNPLYEVEGYRVVDPVDMNELSMLLGGGLLPKIGLSRARRIMSNVSFTLENYTDSIVSALNGMRGLSKSDKEAILERLYEHETAVALDSLFQSCGVQTTGAKLAKRFGRDALQTIRQNPFILGTDFAFMFNDCIHLARTIKKETKCSFQFSDMAICALICFIRQRMRGSTWLDKSKVLDVVSYLELAMDVATPPDGWTIEKTLEDAISENRLVVEEDRIYFREYYMFEVLSAQRLIPLSSYRLTRIPFTPSPKLCDEQNNAIETMLSNPVVIMTGGPGTGKTTTISGVIRPLEAAGFRVGLAAPTGKAAVRLANATGKVAMTVHRLLGIGLKDPDNAPIKLYDAVIIDEASMLDIELLNKLLASLHPGSRLVFVGDFDQLPSVNPGNVLRDLIESECIPVCELVENHRQSRSNGGLAKCINDIRDGVVQDKSIYCGSDLVLVPACGPDEIKEKTLETVSALSKTRGKREVKVLSPFRRENLKCSCEQLNPLLRPLWGINSDSDSQFHEGDIVMMTRNDKKKALFNGDMGIVLQVNEESGTTRIAFGEHNRRILDFEESELGTLILAFAMTVHKSQGSEYKVVVLALVPRSLMMTRRLLYTAISRAQDELIIVGDWETFVSAVNTFENRNTSLAERIRLANGLDPVRIPFVSRRPAVQFEMVFNDEKSMA